MMNIIFAIANHLLESLKFTVLQLFILLGPGLILVVLMNLVSGRVETGAYKLMGRKIYLWGFGWLGTIVHELGHAAMCIVFRHRIVRMSVFDPRKSTNTLGFVDHSYHRTSAYQTVGNFFIGIGPIILGTLVIFLAARFLMGAAFFDPFMVLRFDAQDFQSIATTKALLMNIWHALFIAAHVLISQDFTRWQFYVFIYILFCVGSSMTLSRQDIKSAGFGFLVFFCLLFLFNIIALIFGGVSAAYMTSLSRTYTAFYAVMFFTLFMSFIFIIPISALLACLAVARR